MPAVESAHKREYKLRDISKAGMKAALRVLPPGYSAPTEMVRNHAAYAWRDPDQRFHIIAVNPETGFPAIMSFWAEELRTMLKDEVLFIRAFRLDPELSTQTVDRLAPRGRLPASWLEDAQSR